MQKPKFTLEQGLQIQKQQLEGWEKILKLEVFNKLASYLDAANKKLNEEVHDGNHVLRGTDIDGLLANHRIGHEIGKPL